MEIIGELIVDFNVIQSTTKTLWIGDTSDWVYAEELPAYIYITLPGSRKALEYEFEKGQICTYNSHNLGLTCKTNTCGDEVPYIDIPDGIYTITLKSSYDGFEKTKYYLKTDKTELNLAKIIVANNLEYVKSDKGFRDSVYDIDWMIKVAKSFAVTGDFNKAGQAFNEASSNINKLSDCKNCF